MVIQYLGIKMAPGYHNITVLSYFIDSWGLMDGRFSAAWVSGCYL